MVTKSEYRQMLRDIEEPLSWDPRGSDEEYDCMEKANSSWTELKKLLKQHVEPHLK